MRERPTVRTLSGPSRSEGGHHAAGTRSAPRRPAGGSRTTISITTSTSSWAVGRVPLLRQRQHHRERWTERLARHAALRVGGSTEADSPSRRPASACAGEGPAPGPEVALGAVSDRGSWFRRLQRRPSTEVREESQRPVYQGPWAVSGDRLLWRTSMVDPDAKDSNRVADPGGGPATRGFSTAPLPADRISGPASARTRDEPSPNREGTGRYAQDRREGHRLARGNALNLPSLPRAVPAAPQTLGDVPPAGLDRGELVEPHPLHRPLERVLPAGPGCFAQGTFETVKPLSGPKARSAQQEPQQSSARSAPGTTKSTGRNGLPRSAPSSAPRARRSGTLVPLRCCVDGSYSNKNLVPPAPYSKRPKLSVHTRRTDERHHRQWSSSTGSGPPGSSGGGDSPSSPSQCLPYWSGISPHPQ